MERGERERGNRGRQTKGQRGRGGDGETDRGRESTIIMTILACCFTPSNRPCEDCLQDGKRCRIAWAQSQRM